MASLRPPGLGPLVGATTDSTCRIWIRAGDPADSGPDLDEDRRTVGVIGIVKNGKKKTIGQAWYFRLQREFDRTGTFVVGADVQLGYCEKNFVDKNKPVIKPADLAPSLQAARLTPDTEYTVR